MRILELHLLAFGPFTDVRLDLSAPSPPRPGLHVIYGPNEAGKSTALRAIHGLLYGIPHLTPDAHLHRHTDMRVGGRLENAAGATLQVVRRKGRLKTLFDEADNPSDDSILRPFLGGVSEDLFRTMFGLDHVTLRQGAEALLAGQGDVGESLFGAGLGGAALHQVLEELRRESEEIFTPLAKKRPLNEAIAALRDAQRKAQDAATLPSVWEAQKQQIAEKEAERDRVDAEAREVRAREKRLRRAQRALPLLEARRTLLAERAALGEAVMLPEEAPRDREEALARIAEAEAAAARLRRDLGELTARREAIVIPRSLLELAPEVIDDLQDRLGSHRKATVDLPRVRGELRALEDEARAALRRLGRAPDLGEAEAMRLDVAAEARIKKLARERGEAEARPREAARLLADREARREEQRRRLEELPPPRDAATLRRALARAQRQGDLEQRLREAEGEARRLRVQAEALRDRLGILPAGATAPADLSALPVPPSETVDRFRENHEEVTRQRERLAERGAAVAARLADVGREIDALQRAGEVPTEAQLVEVRGRRDLTFQTLVRALGGAPRKGAREKAAGATASLFDAGVHAGVRADPARRGGAAAAAASGDKAFALTPLEEVPRAQPEAYAELVRQADAVADRLRREAHRVAGLARLLADRKAAEAERAQLGAQEEALAGRRAELGAAWRALWAPSGVEPRSPAEMRGWLARHAQLAAAVERLREAEGEVEAIRERTRACEEELRAALGDAAAAEGAGLADLLEAAGRALAALEDAARERRELAAQGADLAREIAELSRELAAHEAARAAWRAAWAEGVARLGLGPGASPDEAIAILDELSALFRTVDEAAHARRRVQGMERDAQALAAAVEALAAAHAPDLEGLEVEPAADALVKRYHRGRADLLARAELDRRIEDKQQELANEEDRRAAAEARLGRLLAAARAGDLAELAEAERRSREAREMDRRIREVEGKLLEAGEGSSVAALEQETAGMERDALAVELERTEEQIAKIEDARRALDRELGRLEAGREQLRKPMEEAADAAAESAACLARVKAQAERYVRARLAAVILDREIERYRERNQGPILGRASALFRRMTREAYSGLKVSYDEQDHPVLRCVRAPVGGKPAADEEAPARAREPLPEGQLVLPGDAGTIALSREVDVKGLSEGTRDQLYLALRLASLEHHAKRGEPMPLVLDDILIHSDDDRARAALAALGEMADSTQVLFFTHHARLLELAREAVPAAALREHRLG